MATAFETQYLLFHIVTTSIPPRQQPFQAGIASFLVNVGEIVDNLTVYIRFGVVSSVVASVYVFSKHRNGRLVCDG